MAQFQLQKVDYDKTIKSLQNETAVLSAAVETREQKLEDFAAFKDELVTLRKQLNENDQLSNQMVRSMFDDYEYYKLLEEPNVESITLSSYNYQMKITFFRNN